MRLGCDIGRLDHLTLLLDDAAELVARAPADLVLELAVTMWKGPARADAAVCVDQALGIARRLSVRLADLSREARSHADAQRRASDRPLPALDAAPATILFSDLTGDGRAAIAIGDLATATHIAVLVPGMGSDIHNFSRLVADARRLQHQAGTRMGASGSVAVVAWLGYDAPAGLNDPLALAQALTTGRAEAGALALRSFLDDLQRPDDAVITLIGHSYGSLVVVGAARANPEIDQVVVLGSPGLGADRIDLLGLAPSTTFYAGAIPNDPVARTEWFGTDPTTGRFGASPIATEAWPSADEPAITHAHSAYFDQCSQSLDNLARVVSGGFARRSIT